MNKQPFQFTLRATEACKGVALILLLWHHLFCDREYGVIIYGTAILARVCVPIFLILSGYGLTETIRRKRNASVLDFYKKRLINLYANYWLINLIFVPIGIFFCNRSVQSTFNSYPYTKYLLQLTGLHRYFYSEYGVNPTWYYMSVIIPLILLYPVIYVFVRKFGRYSLLLTALVAIGSPVVHIQQLQYYLLPFVLGVYLSGKNGFCRTKMFYAGFSRARYLVLVGIMSIVLGFRCLIPFLFSKSVFLRSLSISEPILGFMIISFVFEITQDIWVLEKILSYLGKHLFNIFLFHTFLYMYYCKSFVYSFGHPLAVLFVFLNLCLLISMAIELIKRVCGYYKIINWVNSYRVASSGKVFE